MFLGLFYSANKAILQNSQQFDHKSYFGTCKRERKKNLFWFFFKKKTLQSGKIQNLDGEFPLKAKTEM
jgi:hypothetical protein